MNAIVLNKEKIILELTDNELLLLCNSLNEVCHGIFVPDFDLRIGTSITDAEVLLKFLGTYFDIGRQLKYNELTNP